MRNAGAEQRFAVRVGQQQDRFGGVADLTLDQARLVVVDERDDVAAGDVARGRR